MSLTLLFQKPAETFTSTAIESLSNTDGFAVIQVPPPWVRRYTNSGMASINQNHVVALRGINLQPSGTPKTAANYWGCYAKAFTLESGGQVKFRLEKFTGALWDLIAESDWQSSAVPFGAKCTFRALEDATQIRVVVLTDLPSTNAIVCSYLYGI